MPPLRRVSLRINLLNRRGVVQVFFVSTAVSLKVLIISDGAAFWSHITNMMLRQGRASLRAAAATVRYLSSHRQGVG